MSLKKDIEILKGEIQWLTKKLRKAKDNEVESIMDEIRDHTATIEMLSYKDLSKKLGSRRIETRHNAFFEVYES